MYSIALKKVYLMIQKSQHRKKKLIQKQKILGALYSTKNKRKGENK